MAMQHGYHGVESISQPIHDDGVSHGRTIWRKRWKSYFPTFSDPALVRVIDSLPH